MTLRLPPSLLFLPAALLVAGAWAQEPDAAAERARIRAERDQAEAGFVAQEKACRARFAVNDCVNDARKRMRDTLADLRRQEITLNDAERKRRAAERLKDIQERQSTTAVQDESRRQQAIQSQLRREQRAADKEAARAAAGGASAPRPPALPQPPAKKGTQLSEEQVEANRKAHARRLAEAEERKEKAARRVLERRKPAASSLPVPP
jgi:colicin import membrane protein